MVPVGIEMSLSRSGTLAFGENPRPANVAPAAIPIGWECVASVEIPHRSAHIARSNRDFEKLTGVHRQGSRDRLADMERKPTPPARTGDMIAGWRLGRHVGEGGFATVWEVHKPFRPDRRLALKLVQMDERARGELNILLDIPHPYLARVHDWAGSDRGAPLGWFALVMNLGEEDLKSSLCRRGPMDSEKVRSIGIGLAAALAYLHDDAAVYQRTIVHGDVKPANMIRFGGRWQLADFGIASMAHLTGSTLYGASLPYAPPEYLKCPYLDTAVSPSPRGDIWSLGVTLFELATGELPPGRGDRDEILRKRDVHHGLASSVESCLSPDASERPKASELYEMLDGIDRPLPPDPAQAVAANADLLWQADRPSGPLHVGALVDRWTSTLTRAAFFESAAEDLHHRGDTNALRALAHTIESFDHPLTRDLLPGVGRLVPAELERRIHRLIGDRKPR